MNHVWILNHYSQGPEGTGPTRHFHLADHLKRYGWQATLIAASEDSPLVQRLAPLESARLDQVSGVPFLWVRTPPYEGNGVRRILNMLAYTWRVLLPRTTRGLPRPDVVIGSSVHPFAAAAGALLAFRFKVPFVFEVRDLWPQTLVEMGRLREGGALTWALRRLELWLYRRAARIVVLLPHAWEYIVPLGIRREKVVWIPNGVDLSLFPKPMSRTEVPASGGFTLMYFGAHGQANGLDTILQAMKIVQESQWGQKIRLRLIGDGPLKPALIAQAEQLGLANVSFEPPVPRKTIPALATEADAFLISVRDLPGLYRYGISMNKLFDYLAAERPIIIASDAVNNPVADAGAGLSVRAGKPIEMASAIHEVASTTAEERLRMGAAGRAYVQQHHDFAELSRKLATTLDEVILRGRPGGAVILHP